MAQGAGIIVSAEPKGVFEEVIINGTPLPGTLLTIDAAVEPVEGVFQFEPATPGGNGQRCGIAVLLADEDQGKTVDDAYATNTRGKVYWVQKGEEVNARVAASGTGTGDAVAIGDKLIVENATGNLIATTGSPEDEPFECRETVADVVSTGTLVRVKRI